MLANNDHIHVLNLLRQNSNQHESHRYLWFHPFLVIIDNKRNFRYDALNFDADGFNNNQFIGTWTSYRTQSIKKCNWGDYRIPECNWKNGCDIGAADFSISDKYLKNGWENYRLAMNDPEKPETQKARQKEAEKWWK